VAGGGGEVFAEEMLDLWSWEERSLMFVEVVVGGGAGDWTGSGLVTVVATLPP
jgi:hypothetical protein